MKNIFVFILLGIFITPSFSQIQKQDPEMQKRVYERKIESFKKMKNTGIGLTIGGVALTAIGVGLMADGIDDTATDGYYYSDYSSSSEEVSSKFVLGYLVTVLGVGSTTGGIVLWAIGGNKHKKYQQRLDGISLNLNPSPNKMFMLAYRF